MKNMVYNGRRSHIWVLAGSFSDWIKHKNCWSWTALVLCPALTFYLFDLFTHNPFTSMNMKTQLLNIAFYELTGILLFGLLRHLKAALMLQSGFFLVAGLANYYVLRFRDTPIRPWDLFSVSTAFSVADNFNYHLEKETLFVILGFGILLYMESRCKLKAPQHYPFRLTIIFLPILLLWNYTGILQSEEFHSKFGLYNKLFTPTVMTKRDGNIVAFLMQLKYIDVDKPEGYSAQEQENLYQQAQNPDLEEILGDPESIHRPNIIVIMDEAFSDLAVLGDFQTNEDYMPFIHSLQKGADNTITGYLNVSVLGGNTANTEFEFLTGNSMAFLPQGSVAYQQYVTKELLSLPWYLKSLGYSTVAIHPYQADGWERDRVYPLLGFDTFLSKNHFVGSEKLRKYITDEACFQRIERLYEKKDPKEPLFVFAVTMQNHSGYEELYDNFTPDIEVEGTSSTALNQYLSLIKQSDQAFEKLVEYFQSVEEDTIIVFFGDHQPNAYVSNPILRQNGISADSLTQEENLLKYKVPYVIWSNFPMASSHGQETSANYLALDILKGCELPLSAQYRKLDEFRAAYPIVTAMQVTDAENRSYIPEDCDKGLQAYQSMQYYLLFDWEP